MTKPPDHADIIRASLYPPVPPPKPCPRCGKRHVVGVGKKRVVQEWRL